MAAKNAFLLGFMGAGKTYWGKQIAARMGWDFCDMDALIEQQEGQSISYIFEHHGEAYFRNLEKICLGHLLKIPQLIVALGGGTPCYKDNMKQLLRSEGSCSIYLEVPPNLLSSRLNHETSKRPLLAGKTESERIVFIKRLLESRNNYYEQAHFSLSVEQQNIDGLENLITGFEG
jgi:shikimate kinase